MIDVRNPGDGFASLRARVSALGPPAASDRGGDGAPLTVGEWALLIDDIVAHPQDNTEGLWNVATPGEDGREYDAIFVGGGAACRYAEYPDLLHTTYEVTWCGLHFIQLCRLRAGQASPVNL